jgi:hypothetical protein
VKNEDGSEKVGAYLSKTQHVGLSHQDEDFDWFVTQILLA